MRADPAADPPQQVVGGDRPDEDHERAPQRARGVRGLAPSTSIRCLIAYCEARAQPTAANTLKKHDGMRDRMAADVAQQERERAMRVARELRVVRVTLGDGELVQLVLLVVERLSVCCALRCQLYVRNPACVRRDPAR